MTTKEKAQLTRLALGPEELILIRDRSAFRDGLHVYKYRPSDLKSREKSGPTNRTKDFQVRLISLAQRLNGSVPYAFTLADGSIRSLDAGLLGFFYNRQPKEVAFSEDADGFITSVRLMKGSHGAASRKSDNFTIPWLMDQGAQPAMSMLIEAAVEGGTVTYGRLAARLRHVLNRRSISPRNMGYVAGGLMNQILALLNLAWVTLREG
jgi:hypothetical protein